MRYIVITPLPFAVWNHSSIVVDRLWARDLEAHKEALPGNISFFVIAPSVHRSIIAFPHILKNSQITFIPLPSFKNSFSFYKKMPQILLHLFSLIKRDDIVHVTGTFYPPLGFLAYFISIIKGAKKRVIVFDADFIGDLELYIAIEKSLVRQYILRLTKIFCSFIIKFVILTSPLTFVVGGQLYKRYVKHGNVVKIYASWVRSKDIISPSDLKQKLQRFLDGEDLKLCFAGRLTIKKNPMCLIPIAKALNDAGVKFTLDIFGEGPLRKVLEKQATHLGLPINFKGVVPYGKQFYETLRNYDIIIPNLSGEQPRIVFDAMANGVLVIATNTPSFDMIVNGENGFLCNPRIPESISSIIEMVYKNKGLYENLVSAGVETVKANTIELSHRRRMRIIAKLFGVMK